MRITVNCAGTCIITPLGESCTARNTQCKPKHTGSLGIDGISEKMEHMCKLVVKGTRCLGSGELVFLLRRELTRSAIYGRQKFDSHKWATVLVDEVKRKPRNFEAYLCRSLYSTFTLSFYPTAFYNKRLQNAFYRPTRPIQGNVFL